MSNALTKSNSGTPAPTKPSALMLMASRLSCDPNKLLSTLRSTVFKGANDEEVMALVVVSNEYELNPLLKEMYAFPAKGGGIVPIVSVDGWNKMLIRQPSFDGIQFSFEHNQDGGIISCTATVHIKGRTYPCIVTEYIEECYRDTALWKSMPHRMLRNRTLCQAVRMAFGFSGVYHEEEAQTSEAGETTVVVSEIPQKVIAAPPREAQATSQEALEAIVIGEGFSIADLLAWGGATGNITDPTSIATFADIKAAEATRIVRNKIGLISALKAQKEGIAA